MAEHSTFQRRAAQPLSVILVLFMAVLMPGCQMTKLKDAVSKPEPEAFVPLRLGEVTPEGWLRAQLERDLVSGYQGHLDTLLQDPKTGQFHLRPENNDFVTRAQNQKFKIDDQGRCVPQTEYTWWPGEMIADWQDGLIRAAFLTGEPNATKKAERFVQDILNSQDEDGYIGIYPKGCRYHFAISDGELWTQRCAMLGLLAYYEFTGRQDVLDAVQKAVKLTLKQYGPGQRYFDNPQQESNGVAHGLLFVDVLDWLYRLTGDNDYRRAAVSLYRDDFCTSKTVRNADIQLKRLLDPKTPLGGHGPDITGMLRVPLLCYYMTGNNTYFKAWENAIHKTEPQLGIGGSPLTGRHEEISTGYRKPWLPYEYCSTFYLLHSLTWGIQKTGDPRYGDMFERTLFNAAQGARLANGKAVTYYSADERLWVRQHAPEGSDCNPRYLYTAAYYPNCCLNSAARAYPYAISAMWMRSRDPDGDGLAATLYGPSRVCTRIGDATVTVVEKTAYPFTFDIDFAVETDRPVRFPLRLRVPQWSTEPAVTADGAAVTRDKDGFIVVSKLWNNGDTVHLTLKPSIQPRVAVDGSVALTYGPLVFCLPLQEKAEITQRFPHAEAMGLEGYYGYEYDADLEYARRRRLWDTTKPGFGFCVIRDEKADLLYPWENPPLKLQGDMLGDGEKTEPVELVPMGTPILRWTCFPRAE